MNRPTRPAAAARPRLPRRPAPPAAARPTAPRRRALAAARDRHASTFDPADVARSLMPHAAPTDELPAVRLATARDLPFMLTLAKRWTDAVGFLPREAVDWYVSAGSVRICVENGDSAGYLLTRDHLASSPAIRPILQAAVCLDAQRRYHGLRLVDSVIRDARSAGRKILQLKCREAIEANQFWRAAGFELVGHQDAGGRRGGRICVWSYLVSPISAADLILKTVERHRGPGGFFSSKPLVITPAVPAPATAAA